MYTHRVKVYETCSRCGKLRNTGDRLQLRCIEGIGLVCDPCIEKRTQALLQRLSAAQCRKKAIWVRTFLQEQHSLVLDLMTLGMTMEEAEVATVLQAADDLALAFEDNPVTAADLEKLFG